jgi:KDO2-lipid IV(A) lauroyltransferase
VTLRHRVEYAALRAFAAAVRLLGVRAGSALARVLADVYRLCDVRHRRVAETNLRERLGVAPDEARRIARESFRHLFVSAVEILHLDREVERRGIDDVLAIEGREHMEAARPGGRGAILVTAHLAAAGRHHGWPFTTVYRPLDNPLLDRWVRESRAAHGQELVPKEGALRPLLRALRDGRFAVLLVDQDARRHGVMAPFLGRPASTIPTPAELALRTGAAIITATSERTGPGFRYAVRVGPPLELAPTGDHAADVLRITAAINARLEAAVRARPEQWLWAHRRWKTAPPEPGPAPHEAADPDGGSERGPSR